MGFPLQVGATWLRRSLHRGGCGRITLRSWLVLASLAAALLLGRSASAQPATGLPEEPEKPEEVTPPPTAPGETVAEVKVSGNKRIETTAILNLLETKPGRPFDLQTIRKDLRTLWQQRYFNDIKVGDILECYTKEQIARTLASSAAAS